MDGITWQEWLTAIAAALTIVGVATTFINWGVRKASAKNDARFNLLEGHLSGIKSEFKLGFQHIDSDMKAFRAEMTAANQRIDTLYQMFVDLLKEGRK